MKAFPVLFNQELKSHDVLFRENLPISALPAQLLRPVWFRHTQLNGNQFKATLLKFPPLNMMIKFPTSRLAKLLNNQVYSEPFYQ